MAFSFRISRNTIGQIVKKVYIAICNTFASRHMTPPKETNFKQMAKDFEGRWGFPNCIGCIDEKHI